MLMHGSKARPGREFWRKGGNSSCRFREEPTNTKDWKRERSNNSYRKCGRGGTQTSSKGEKKGGPDSSGASGVFVFYDEGGKTVARPMEKDGGDLF